ncbi:MAG TPA: DNA-binding response regulator [Lachnospiraceae bacterium]|nr:DNA-binding response regulator [Lachnospiraceae bacterium]
MKEFILIVDDDSDIRRLLGIYLGNEGYRYLACENAAKALDVLEHYQVDLILLDVMMPGIDGVSACLKIREKNKMPIIFMSAKTEDMDIIQGLMAGGDDYVTKPFKPVQLLTRIKAQLRRYKQYNDAEKPAHTLQADDLTVDTESRQVWVSGREVRLTRKEYDILEYLLRNRGQVLTMAQIYEAVWHEEFFHSENTVMMHIANLRGKLNWDNAHPDFIKTCWGRGYQI